MVDVPGPAERFVADAELFPTFDGDTRHVLLKRARDGDARAHHDYVYAYAVCLRAARIALQARPPCLSRVDAVHEGRLVLRELVDDPDIVDPEQVLTERVLDRLRAIQPPPAGT